jgi:hypothetical protein
MHKCQSPLNEAFNDALKTSDFLLAFEERYKDVACQVCKALSRAISRRRKPRKSPTKSRRWDLLPEAECVTIKR